MDWNNINRDRDTSGLGPIEYDQSKVPALIRKHANNVRGKSYGQQVREAQARNAEYAGLIASESCVLAKNADYIAKDTQNRFKDQIDGTTNSDEIIDARRPFGKEAFSTLGERLNTEHHGLRSDINGIGVSPIHYGETGNGVTPETQVITSAFEHGDYVLLPQGKTYVIDDVIDIPTGKILDFNHCVVKFLNGNSSFNISPNAILRNARVRIDGSIFQDNPIVNFDGNKQFFLGDTETHAVQNVSAEKTGGEYHRQGEFIHLNATQESDGKAAVISGIQLENIKSFRFEYGIRITLSGKTNSEKTSYVTGNIVRGYHSYHPSKAIWEDDLVGNNVQLSDNCYEDVQVRADYLPITFLRLVGRLNIFRSFIPWYYHRATNTDQFVIKGSYNHIEGTMPSYNSDVVQDTGKRNTIISINTGVPTYKIQNLVTEFSPRTLLSGVSHVIPLNLFRLQNTIDSKTAATDLMTFKYRKQDINTGVVKVDFKSFGSAKINTTRYFLMYVNGEYIIGGSSGLVQSDAYNVNAKFVIARYDNSQLTVRCILVTEDGQKYAGRKFIDVSNADEINLQVTFRSGNNGDMICYYREANMIKP